MSCHDTNINNEKAKQLLRVCHSFVPLWYTFSSIFIYNVWFPILKFLLVENDSAFVNVHHEMLEQYAHIDRKSGATKGFFTSKQQSDVLGIMSDISESFSYCVFKLLSLRRFLNLFNWKNILVCVLVIMTKEALTMKQKTMSWFISISCL